MAGVESLVEGGEGLEADHFGDGDDRVVGRGEQHFGFVEAAGADVLGEADTQLAVEVSAQVGFVGRETAGKHPDGEVGVVQEVGGEEEEERGVFGGLHRDGGSVWWLCRGRRFCLRRRCDPPTVSAVSLVERNQIPPQSLPQSAASGQQREDVSAQCRDRQVVDQLRELERSEHSYH